MYRVKPILSFVAVAAFLVAVTSGSVEAGALEGKKLLVDTNYSMMDAGDRVNDGVNTLAPVAAGDTVKVELFIEDGGGVPLIGGEVKFADSNMEMMFDETWKVVAVSSIVPAAPGISPQIAKNAFSLLSLAPNDVPENGYLGTVKIVALADIKDGSSFYVKSAALSSGTSLQSIESDSLDVTEAIVTFADPYGP